MPNTPALLVLFSSSSASRSISAVLLRVTAAMAGAVCGQTLPVVVKKHRPFHALLDLSLALLLSFFFLCPYCTALTDRAGGEREKEKGRARSMNVQ